MTTPRTIPAECKDAASKAFELSAVAAREGTPAAHKEAAQAHKNAAALFTENKLWPADGAHLRLAAYHDELGGQGTPGLNFAPELAPELALRAQAKAWGENNNVKDPAAALAGFIHTKHGAATYEIYCMTLGQRTPR